MPMVFQSQVMHKLLESTRRIARCNATVLITGESGTGKELLTRALHQASPRAEQPFVAVNCASLPEQLVESELFGHESGAFTGADSRRIGRFEAAQRGTLFLDEIGELPRSTQPKLLRALEENEFQRLGSNDIRSADARVVVATNRDLLREVDARRFRADLYYRLNVLTLHVPPLRERSEDVPTLVSHFVERFAGEGEVRVRGFSGEAMRALAGHDWPGNIRQLRNVVRRACILATQEIIPHVELPQADDGAAEDVELPKLLERLSLREIERSVILHRLKRCRGNRSKVAATLGVTTRTLRNKMSEYRRLGYSV
jgi:two-component system response regulator HydG